MPSMTSQAVQDPVGRTSERRIELFRNKVLQSQHIKYNTTGIIPIAPNNSGKSLVQHLIAKDFSEELAET